MKMSMKFLALCICTFLGLANGQKQPGVTVQISGEGLNYAGTEAVNLLAKRLEKQEIKDRSEDGKELPVGKVNYSITNVRITSFTKPSSTVTTGSASTLTWYVMNAGITVTGNWAYKYKLWFIKISDSGTFNVNIGGASASVTLSLGRLSNGRPTIRMLSCSSHMASVKVKFSSGESWLYNLFSGFVERPLKKELEKLVCEAAEKVININANAKIDTLQTRVTLKKAFELDYSLLTNPQLVNGYLQTAHKGEVFYYTDNTPTPFSGPFVSTPAPSRMVCVYVNQFVANSLGYVIHKYNLLWYTLTKEDVKESYRSIFSTSCTSDNDVCFGKLFPTAASRYPNASLEINMTTSAAPTLSISAETVTANITGRMKIYMRLPNDDTANLLSLRVTIILKVTPSVQGQRILTTVTEFMPEATMENTEIGTVEAKSLNKLLKIVGNAFIIPKLNKVGMEGLALPNVHGVTFVGPSVTLTSGAVVVCTDVKYTVQDGS